MLEKVLIANRGEIAVRIARALRELGIGSVAIYSDADRLAHHVRVADEAHWVGPAQATESYLDAERILEVAQKSGCDAIHPGYGFLSENANFARACEARGVKFVGPSPHALEIAGHKTRARDLMQDAGVPVVPGGSAGDLDEARHTAREIGYPVVLKPASGGGGKGMRQVRDEAELEREWQSAKSEAERSFLNGEMYLERCLIRPRHVEIQVLGDRDGKLIHLFERDCSIQRRHQKIIEEAPCPILSPAVLVQMCETSLVGARALGYCSVGTFEYLLDESGQFYFLEINPRLQVEHGITELTTGVDLVTEMLRVASDLPLTLEQTDVVRRGHAIECRVYAEDPARGFMPSPGRIDRLQLPEGPGTRNDEGALAGDEVTDHYDPMISKLMTWGSDRKQCLARMLRALGEYCLDGPQTNLEFCARVLAHADYQSGQYDTSFVVDKRSELTQHTLDDLDPARVAAAAALAHDAARAQKGGDSTRTVGLTPWIAEHRAALLRRRA
jgi:acetyl-CoA carboxylase biotin carboxylase subunit